MAILYLLSLLYTSYSQITPPSVTLMSTLTLPTQGNYSIGYLPLSSSPAGSAGPVNSSACRRISMFKFPALLSGTATSMTLNALPELIQETCDIGFTLYLFPSGNIVGTFVGAFTNLIGLREESMTVDITSAKWSFVNGSLYYLMIQTFTWNTAGTHCNMRLPWGLLSMGSGTANPGVGSNYAIVAQQGPNDQPCGTTPWVTQTAMDGGYIHMSIMGVMNTSSSTVTPSSTATPSSTGTATGTPSSTVTPTGTATGTPSSTGTPSVSNTGTSIYNATNSDTGTATATATATATGTGTPTGTVSVSNSDANTNTNTNTNINTGTATATATGTRRANPTSLNIGANGIATTDQIPGIVGGSIGLSLAIIALLLCFLHSIYCKQPKPDINSIRSPVSSIIVENPVNPVIFHQNTLV